MPALSPTFTRQTEIGDIAASVRRMLTRAIWPIIIVSMIEVAILGMKGEPGATAFGLIALGNIIILAVWAKTGVGLPIVPMIGIQNLLIYGLPIATHNETILPYPQPIMTDAGWEVLVFSLALIGAWRVAMHLVPTYSRWCYALEGLSENSPRLARMGMTMVICSTAYKLLDSLGLLSSLLDLLPSGSRSIVTVLVTAVSGCGFFLVGMMIGRGALTRTQRIGFWVMLALQAYIAASGFLLSATIIVIFSVVTGIFWGSGKLPWRFIIIAVLILSFLNLGKFAMRDRYWSQGEDDTPASFTLSETPKYYGEWIGASWGALLGTPTEKDSAWGNMASDGEKDDGQSMVERINNLQNLLFVVDVVSSGSVAPVGGATYSLIPPLFVPRVLWPDKPRTHAGQVLLNVHFGRQDARATFRTYIAWGLIPEAYGNFGPITGSLLIGAVMGFALAWIEKFVARKLVMSTEGFLSFTLFLGMANSFEMVASVLLTSLFQASVPVILAAAPFVHRMLPKQKQE